MARPRWAWHQRTTKWRAQAGRDRLQPLSGATTLGAALCSRYWARPRWARHFAVVCCLRHAGHATSQPFLGTTTLGAALCSHLLPPPRWACHVAAAASRFVSAGAPGVAWRLCPETDLLRTRGARGRLESCPHPICRLRAQPPGRREERGAAVSPSLLPRPGATARIQAPGRRLSFPLTARRHRPKSKPRRPRGLIERITYRGAEDFAAQPSGSTGGGWTSASSQERARRRIAAGRDGFHR